MSFLEVTHVAVGLVLSVLGGAAALLAHVSRAAAREALQNRRLDEFEKWKDSRGERDDRIYEKLDQLAADVAWLKAHAGNGSGR